MNSYMVAGKYTYISASKEKQRTNGHKTIHYNNQSSSRKLKKTTTKVVKDHITYSETGRTQTNAAKASKQSPNQPAKQSKTSKTEKSSKSMWSALLDLDSAAAQMENANHSTMAPSPAKAKSNTNAQTANKAKTSKSSKNSISMWSALLDLENAAAQMENSNHSTMAPSPAKNPESSTYDQTAKKSKKAKISKSSKSTEIVSPSGIHQASVSYLACMLNFSSAGKSTIISGLS